MTSTCNFLSLEISWKRLLHRIHGDIHKSLMCERQQCESRQLEVQCPVMYRIGEALYRSPTASANVPQTCSEINS